LSDKLIHKAVIGQRGRKAAIDRNIRSPPTCRNV